MTVKKIDFSSLKLFQIFKRNVKLEQPSLNAVRIKRQKNANPLFMAIPLDGLGVCTHVEVQAFLANLSANAPSSSIFRTRNSNDTVKKISQSRYQTANCPTAHRAIFKLMG
jgi:hypothetical protein